MDPISRRATMLGALLRMPQGSAFENESRSEAADRKALHHAKVAGESDERVQTNPPAIAVVKSIEELRSSGTRPPVVVVLGDGHSDHQGRGLFLWQADSAIAPDQYTSLAVADETTGRYIRYDQSAFNVKWAGASGDGSTDDTLAFRRALAVAQAVFVPPGIYRVAETLHLDGQTLYGVGHSSIISCATSDFDLFDVSGSGTQLTRLALWGAASNADSSQFGVMTSVSSPPRNFSATELLLSGPDHFKGFNNGIKFEDGASNSRVERCYFERLIGDKRNGYGILTGAVDGLIVASNVFQGSRDRKQGRHAVYISAGGRRAVVVDNIVHDFNHEALTTNSYEHHDPVQEISFAHNIVYRCGADGPNQCSIGIFGRAKTARIEGNVVVESFGSGILSDAGNVAQESITIDDNTVIDANYFGIRQIGALQQAVRGNYVRGSSRRSPRLWADIVIGSASRFAVEQILISSNQCVGTVNQSCRPFILDASTPLPLSVRVYGNDFPEKGYLAGPDYGPAAVDCLVDGRRQLDFWFPVGRFKPREAKTIVVSASHVRNQDLVLCGHPAVLSAFALSVSAGDGNVAFTFTNLHDRDATVGELKFVLDVWPR